MAKRMYFIGIGGISMSALAIFQAASGNIVSGSDISNSDALNIFKNFNIPVYIGHKKENIKAFNPNLVVINCAIKEDNEELKWAIAHKKKIITRAELLGNVSKTFKNVIAISGTHGKTTTSALISEIFIEAKLKPSIHVGGILKRCESNFLIGEKKFFITEACEYQNSFLSLQPTLGIVLNIEPDHLDFFKNMKEINNSFEKFLENSKNKILKIDEFVYMLKNEKNCSFYCAKNLKKSNVGFSFDFYKNDICLAKIQTNFFGQHNVKNTLVACIVADFYKIKMPIVKRAIKNFGGVKRRFEEITKVNNSVVIHDYAHHPTEIEKVICQAKRYGKVLTVFQPHTYSRTKKLFKDFLSCFNLTDGLVLIKTYPAREEEVKGATAKDIYNQILSKNPLFFSEDFSYNNQIEKVDNFIQNDLIFKNQISSQFKQCLKKQNYSQINQNIPLDNFVQNNQNLKPCYYFDEFENARQKLISLSQIYNCILILGAGNINELAYMLKRKENNSN